MSLCREDWLERIGVVLVLGTQILTTRFDEPSRTMNSGRAFHPSEPRAGGAFHRAPVGLGHVHTDAWTGLALGFMSLALIQRVVARRLGRTPFWLFASAVIAA